MASERHSRRSPDRPPTHPGAFLRAIVLPASGHTKSEIATLLNVSRQHLYDLLDGRSGVSAGMALRLGRLFGNGARLWLNMQRTYDLWYAERTLADEVAGITPLAPAVEDEDTPKQAISKRYRPATPQAPAAKKVAPGATPLAGKARIRRTGPAAGPVFHQAAARSAAKSTTARKPGSSRRSTKGPPKDRRS
jgi:addiction module HigA family antidote